MSKIMENLVFMRTINEIEHMRAKWLEAENELAAEKERSSQLKRKLAEANEMIDFLNKKVTYE